MSFNVQAALNVARKYPDMRAQTVGLILKEAAKKDDFARQISKLVHKGEEDIIDVKEEKGSEKKASVKVAAGPKNFVNPKMATQLYDFIKAQYPEDEKLLALAKEYLEVDLENLLKREADKVAILQQELVDKLEALNKTAKAKREEGWGYLKTRLWLRKQRKDLKKEIKMKESNAREEANRGIRELIVSYERKHPRFVVVMEEQGWDDLKNILKKQAVVFLSIYATLLIAAAVL